MSSCANGAAWWWGGGATTVRRQRKKHSHPRAPVGDLVAVARDLEALAGLLEAHDGDVGQALLPDGLEHVARHFWWWRGRRCSRHCPTAVAAVAGALLSCSVARRTRPSLGDLLWRRCRRALFVRERKAEGWRRLRRRERAETIDVGAIDGRRGRGKGSVCCGGTRASVRVLVCGVVARLDVLCVRAL